MIFNFPYFLGRKLILVLYFSSFFKAGNYLGAISAFSHGIKLGSKMPELYSNRAAAHLALGNFNKCIQDSSTVSILYYEDLYFIEFFLCYWETSHFHIQLLP